MTIKCHDRGPRKFKGTLPTALFVIPAKAEIQWVSNERSGFRLSQE